MNSTDTSLRTPPEWGAKLISPSSQQPELSRVKKKSWNARCKKPRDLPACSRAAYRSACTVCPKIPQLSLDWSDGRPLSTTNGISAVYTFRDSCRPLSSSCQSRRKLRLTKSSTSYKRCQDDFRDSDQAGSRNRERLLRRLDVR